MKKQLVLVLLTLIPFSISFSTLKEFPKTKKAPKEKWFTAEASYYDSRDEDQTGNTTGRGASGRMIRSGSIAFGSSYTKDILSDNKVIYIKIKDMNVVTPYGKGIFRVDDRMGNKFNKEGQYYIDFFYKDLNERQIDRGRFKVKFKIIKTS